MFKVQYSIQSSNDCPRNSKNNEDIIQTLTVAAHFISRWLKNKISFHEISALLKKNKITFLSCIDIYITIEKKYIPMKMAKMSNISYWQTRIHPTTLANIHPISVYS